MRFKLLMQMVLSSTLFMFMHYVNHWGEGMMESFIMVQGVQEKGKIYK